MSRAMGDFELKNNINLDMRDQAISNEPEIRKVGVATYAYAALPFSCKQATLTSPNLRQQGRAIRCAGL
jgi:hypothetical protein